MDGAAAEAPAEALGDILRAALLEGRAHIRNDQGQARPVIAGLAGQEQGLEHVGEHDGWPRYRGRGVPFYWLPDDEALGVRSESLQTLVKHRRR